jgi:hypothetical protein
MAKKTQIQKFKEASRELETDNDEKRFNEKLGKIARQKPKERKSGRPKAENSDSHSSLGRAGCHF